MLKGTKSQQGFTLIELVVVVAILGLLAIIVTPRVLGAVDNARTNSHQSSAKQIQVAMKRHNAETGAYPTAADMCTSTTTPPCTADKLAAELANYASVDTPFTATYTVDATNSTYTIAITFTNTTPNRTYTINQNKITGP